MLTIKAHLIQPIRDKKMRSGLHREGDKCEMLNTK